MVETLHLLSTTFMAGVIVFVQIVHYPLMARVRGSDFPSYESSHMVRTAWVVVPPMLLEAGTALWLVARSLGTQQVVPALAGAALVGVIWLSTALLQAPAHGRLTHGFDGDTHRRLVVSNWIRTGAWLARVPVAVVLLR